MWQHWTSVFAQSPQVHIDYEVNRAIKWVRAHQVQVARQVFLWGSKRLRLNADRPLQISPELPSASHTPQLPIYFLLHLFMFPAWSRRYFSLHSLLQISFLSGCLTKGCSRSRDGLPILTFSCYRVNFCALMRILQIKIDLKHDGGSTYF